MSIFKKYKANEIVLIKLLNGETIIGKFLKTDNETVTLNRPMQFAIDPNNQGKLAVIDYNVFGKTPEVTFAKDTVLFADYLVDSVAEQYLKQTSSVILPENGLVL